MRDGSHSEAVEARLKRLEKAAAVRQGISAYCRALDDGDLAGVREILDADVALVAGSLRIEGADEVLAHLAQQIAKRTWAKHIVGECVVEGLDSPAPIALAPFLFISKSIEGVSLKVGQYAARVGPKGGEDIRFDELRINVELQLAGLS